MNTSAEQLTRELDSFDAAERSAALRRLAEMASKRQIEPEPGAGWINLHCHTFFSYNAYGYSPSRFAWEAWRQGLEVAGIVDFDCLDGVGEFLQAGRLLGLKTIAGFETRVFIKEYRDRVINSPKEPGVFYLVGTGFVAPPEPGGSAAVLMADMARRARKRNVNMMRRINEHLDPVCIDYERDVLPLSAAANATERHMLDAYVSRAREHFQGGEALSGFWSEKTGESRERVLELLADPPALKDLLRGRLMKHGGVVYAPPGQGAFPSLEQVVEMTLACGALPSGCWLDGTEEGEADPRAHFEFFLGKGVPTITMIPDRNWNVKPSQRDLKVANLNEAVGAARELAMPILVGTEMNKSGTRFVDDFAGDALAPHLDEFRRGAHIAWGHTLLKMTAGVGYVGPWAERHFAGRPGEKNLFFERIGRADYPGPEPRRECAGLGRGGQPEEFLRLLCG